MSYMFSGAVVFNQPLSTFNTAAVTDMNWMFRAANTFNQPLTNFDTSKVTNMSYMFSGATAFNQPLIGWNVGAVTNMSYMFDESGYTTTIYDQTLGILAGQTLRPNVTLSAAGVTYCNDVAHAALTTAPNNWTITDGGFCPPSVTAPSNLQVISTTMPTVSGIALSGRTVNVAIDGANHTVTAQTDGTYSYLVGAALSDGWHTVVVRSIDSLGVPGVPAQLAFYVHTGGSLSLSGSVQAPTLSWNKAPGAATGTVWQETAQGATSFPARGGFGVAALSDKLWVIGGQGTSGRLNDVWSSADGVSWTQALAHTPWSARNSHTLTAFNGKLWVMGGSGTGGYLNDIWSSPDGINWTQETVSAPWSPRAGFKVVEYNNKLWLMGGVGSSGGLQDVWNSPDGVNWTLVTSTAAWPTRNGFGAAAFNGKLWVMGGANSGYYPFTNDVWSSPDGITWTEETTSAAWPVRASHQVEVFDGKLWLLGGSSDKWDGEYSDVWFSENGKDWIKTTDRADWQARRGHSSAVFDNKLWVLGGRVGQSWVHSNDVWSAGIPATTYTVCWDIVQGGCAHTATTANLSFVLPENLAKTTWFFSVKATGPSGQSLGGFTSSPYRVTNPVPTITSLAGKPVVHPVTGVPSVVKVAPTLAGASLSVASYDCSDVKAPTVRLIEPDGLKAPDASVTLLGGVGFSVGCTGAGKSADVALTLGATYRDTSKLRAYKQSGGKLTDITGQVTFANIIINGTTKTIASYALTDGGSLDEDGAANGTLVDPLFIGVLPEAGGMLAATGMSAWAVMAGGLSTIAAGVVVALAARHHRRLESRR